MKGLALAALALFALGGACAAPCHRIQQAMCACRYKTTDGRSSCEKDAEQQADIQPPTDAQEDVCAQLLPGCEELLESNCDALNTPQGEKACGISR